MRALHAIAFLVLLPIGLHSEVFTGEALNTPFTVHGRLHYYNGCGEMRIWIVGSKRILSVKDGPVNQKLNAILGEDGDVFSRTIYGDFTVDPTEADTKGHMRHVKVLAAKNLVIERDADQKVLLTRKEL
jgi:hypothetical protein